MSSSDQLPPRKDYEASPLYGDFVNLYDEMSMAPRIIKLARYICFGWIHNIPLTQRRNQKLSLDIGIVTAEQIIEVRGGNADARHF